MIRRFLLTVVVLSLAGSTLYFYWQTVQLTQENNHLKQQLVGQISRDDRHDRRWNRNVTSPPRVPLDLRQLAEIHTERAEKALAAGNFGESVDESKEATSDLKQWVNGEGSSAGNAISNIKGRLAAVGQKAAQCLHTTKG